MYTYNIASCKIIYKLVVTNIVINSELFDNAINNYWVGGDSNYGIEKTMSNDKFLVLDLRQVEPTRGQFDFTHIDRALDNVGKVNDHGYKTRDFLSR